ncbi:MAG: hypothetical protein HS132_06520 [Planctomycetia bacterium]|nr:hypothetical protein [Planctomycetia bacterium]
MNSKSRQRVSETGTAIQQQTDVSPLVDEDHKASALRASSLPPVPHLSAGKRYNEWLYMDKSGSPDWNIMLDNLAAEIKTRHYSRKKLKAYAE